MIDFLVESWDWLVPLAAALLASILNRITKHPDLAQGWVQRLVLVAIDLLAILESVGSMNNNGQRGVPLKMPLLRRSPPAIPGSQWLEGKR